MWCIVSTYIAKQHVKLNEKTHSINYANIIDIAIYCVVGIYLLNMYYVLLLVLL